MARQPGFSGRHRATRAEAPAAAHANTHELIGWCDEPDARLMHTGWSARADATVQANGRAGSGQVGAVLLPIGPPRKTCMQELASGSLQRRSALGQYHHLPVLLYRRPATRRGGAWLWDTGTPPVLAWTVAGCIASSAAVNVGRLVSPQPRPTLTWPPLLRGWYRRRLASGARGGAETLSQGCQLSFCCGSRRLLCRWGGREGVSAAPSMAGAEGGEKAGRSSAMAMGARPRFL